MLEFLKDEATGKIRLTKATIEDKRSRFGRAGIDIRTIDTEEKLHLAMAKSLYVWAADMLELVKGHPELEKALAPLQEITPLPLETGSCSTDYEGLTREVAHEDLVEFSRHLCVQYWERICGK
jgi:hypothetical protein